MMQLPRQTTMMYADITVASKKKHPSMPSVLDLDDSHVAYAQIEHKLDEDKTSDSAFLLTDKSYPKHSKSKRIKIILG